MRFLLWPVLLLRFNLGYVKYIFVKRKAACAAFPGNELQKVVAAPLRGGARGKAESDDDRSRQDDVRYICLRGYWVRPAGKGTRRFDAG